MDKFKHSDKFQQLRLNLTAASRSKHKDINLKENQAKNLTELKVHKDRREILKNTILRQSPRRHPQIQKLDFSGPQCSFGSKSDNKNQNVFIKSGKLKNNEGNSYRDEAPSVVPQQKQPAFVENLKRDTSGFLKPLHPAPRNKIHSNHVVEEMKTFNYLMQRLTDCNIFREVETVYHCEKIFNQIRNHTCKLVKKARSNENPTTDSSSTQSWFPSSRETSGVYGSRMDINNSKISSSHSSNPSTGDVNKNNIFLLKDWSVIKGSGKTELMVSGILVDAWTRKVIEQNHRSSCIVEKTGNNCVRTVCCSYQLSGKFFDREKRVPQEIKQYFMDNNFPDNWELLVTKWHSLNSINSYTNRRNTSNINVSSKRSLEDSPCKNKLIKRLKPSSSRFLHETFGRGRTDSAPEESALNLSVQTRAAVRKNKLPMFEG